MKKKWFMLLIAMVMVFLLGCGVSKDVDAKEKSKNNVFMEFIGYASDNMDIEEWRDT